MKKIEFSDEGCILALDLTAAQIRKFREDVGMTQDEFAKEFDIPLGTLRRWEQGVNTPRATNSFMRLIQRILLRSTPQTQ